MDPVLLLIIGDMSILVLGVYWATREPSHEYGVSKQ